MINLLIFFLLEWTFPPLEKLNVRRVIKEGFSPLFLFKYPIRRAGRGRLGPNFTDRTIAQNFHSNLAIAQLHSESPEIPIHTAL
nr:MAG TPA: hypothetical protein [Bacteriophage sp.]